MLVRSKTSADPEITRSRMELIERKKPAELGEIRGIGDFPLPAQIETLVRKNKRTLKQTKEKDLAKKKR